jgi:hypothetical protein
VSQVISLKRDTTVSIQIVVFWVTAACSIVDGYQLLGGGVAAISRLILVLDATCFYESLVYTKRITRCHILKAMI